MKTNQTFLHIILSLLLFLTFFPFLFLIINSLKDVPQFYQNFWGISFPLHWGNFIEAWNGVKRFILNSIFVSLVSLIGILVIGSSTAYIFARFDFRFKNALFYGILMLLMVPGILTLIPTFMVVKSLKLLDTHWALILPYISGGQVIAIFLLRSFFETIPDDIFDAATIDGCPERMILLKIVLPLSRPILGTVAIISLLSTWNEFIWPFVTLQSPDKFVLPVGLLTFSAGATNMLLGVNYGTIFAGYIIASIPLIILFLLTMKTFIKGITSGAVKF